MPIGSFSSISANGPGLLIAVIDRRSFPYRRSNVLYPPIRAVPRIYSVEERWNRFTVLLLFFIFLFLLLLPSPAEWNEIVDTTETWWCCHLTPFFLSSILYYTQHQQHLRDRQETLMLCNRYKKKKKILGLNQPNI